MSSVFFCLVMCMFKCPHCKKDNAVKHGIRKNKSGFVQKYLCMDCDKFFVKRDGFEHMKTKPEIIVTALDLRAKGLSFGKIQDHIFQKYKVKVSRSNILYWQQKFGEMIDNFTKSFQLSHSFNLHADEIFFKTKGQIPGEFIYYWDAIDYDTKFLVADHISLERSEDQAKTFMTNIKNNIMKYPEFMHTDNSYDYPPSIRKTFGRGNVIHIHFPAWKHKFKNNPIERFHNTIKENYKTMRRFNKIESAQKYLTFFRNYYNYLRPHKTLNWQTPSQIAGLGQWTWYKIIKSQISPKTSYYLS